ncbi:MAG: hypothetical protein GY888_03930, partial [Planctomycetaceae bacterium]|nr:hypothetical protein [Planctomycetaceae bacterium]
AFAAVLLDKKVAPELLAQYQWVAGLRRPVLGVRWGIGIQFIGSKDAAKNPYPIGKDQKLPEKGSSRNRNRGGGDDLGDPGDFDGADAGFADDDPSGGFPGSGAGRNGNSELGKYTGDLGNKVIQRLQGRIERGYYGTVLKEALAGGGSAAGQGNQGGGFGPGGFDPADEGLDEGLDPGDDGLDGAGFAGPGGGGFPGSGGGRRGGSQNDLPGVSMLGVGTLDQLSAKAQQQNLDVAIIFEVKVTVNSRTKLVTNNTTIQLYDVESAKVVKKNKTVLNNVKIQIKNKTAKGDEVDEMIEKEIDQIFLAAEAYRVKEMPALTPELVLNNRVIPMVKKDYPNPLPVLAELRFWHGRKLLTTEHLVIACKELLDEAAANQLLNGDEKSQAAVVKTWLPGGAAARESSSTPFR